VKSYSVERERYKLDIDVGAVSLSIEHAIPCGLIFNELLVNVMKHTFPDGHFGETHVSMHMAEHSLNMEVRDDGAGLSDDFDIATSPL